LLRHLQKKWSSTKPKQKLQCLKGGKIMGVSILDKSVTRGQLQILAKDTVVQKGMGGQKAQVVGVFDTSGSTEFPESRFYSDGIMDALGTRVLYVAMELDDNGEIPVYRLTDQVERVRDDLTMANLDTYVAKNFPKYSIGGGTRYAPTIRRVVEDARREAQPGVPVLVVLFTDGENDQSDHRDARQALIDASRYPIFFQWFGIYGKGREPAFSFLHSMDEMEGRVVDNAGFSPLGVHEVTNEDLMAALIHEFRDYPAKAAAAGILDWSGGPRSGGLGGWFRRG
jgi:hypothetical protein